MGKSSNSFIAPYVLDEEDVCVEATPLPRAPMGARLSSGRGSGKTYTMIENAVRHQQQLGGTVLIIASSMAHSRDLIALWHRLDSRRLTVSSTVIAIVGVGGRVEEVVAEFTGSFAVPKIDVGRYSAVFYDNKVLEDAREVEARTRRIIESGNPLPSTFIPQS